MGKSNTTKPEKLPEVPYSASAGLLAFPTGPISKFTSSMLEHLHKRLGRESRGQILQAFQCFTCTHTELHHKQENSEIIVCPLLLKSFHYVFIKL